MRGVSERKKHLAGRRGGKDMRGGELFRELLEYGKKRIGNGQMTFPVPLRLIYREGERRKRKRKKNGFSTVTYFVTFSFVTKYVPLSSLAICDALSRLQTK